MKLFERKLGKKTAVLTGAMILSLAMATAAYAGTADRADVDMQDIQATDGVQMEAAKMTPAIKATDLEIKEFKETKPEVVEATKMTDSIEATKVETIDLNLPDDVKMTKVELTDVTEMTDLEMTDAVDAVEITMVAMPVEK